MTDDSEGLDLTKLETPLEHRIIGCFEIISFAVMIIPYGLMTYWIITSLSSNADNFSIFPTALYLFLPTAVLAFFVQLAKYFEIRPTNEFSLITLGCSALAVVIGILAWMLIYIAVA